MARKGMFSVPGLRARGFVLLAALLAAVFLSSSCSPVSGSPSGYYVAPAATSHMGAPAAPVQGELAVWFVDVGQADCALLSDGSASVLVDAGGNATAKDVVAFLREQGIERLDYAIGTHPHEDHVGGLDAVLDAVPVDTLILPEKEGDTKTYEDVLDAARRNGVSIVRAKPESVYRVGTYTMTLLGPVKLYDDMNNNSVVARVDHGENVFLFTGDIEAAAEKDILSMGYDVECTVLKAPHHGSETSSSYVFLRAAYPEMVVVSCGLDNSYGHPHDGPMSRYRDAGATVYRTDTLGSIRMTSDGRSITVDAQGEASPVRRAPKDADGLSGGASINVQEYIGNTNTKKFHMPNCSGLPSEKNRVVLESREEAVQRGYAPCGLCKP